MDQEKTKSYSGRELGIMELTNTALIFRQSLYNHKEENIVSTEYLQHLVNQITDRKDLEIYENYISIHKWLNIKYNIAQTQFQQTQLQFVNLTSFVTQASLMEDMYNYVQSLPVIMTEKQYKDAKKYHKTLCNNKKDMVNYNLIDLIRTYVCYYLKVLSENPLNDNPLKIIRKKYINEPVSSNIINSSYNKFANYGYYVLPDGERSDKISEIEFYTILKSYDKTIEDTDELLQKYCKKRYYKNPPRNLTKWDIIEQNFLFEIYNQEQYSFTDCVNDLYHEFRELIDMALEDISRNYYSEDINILQIPLEKWNDRIFAFNTLCENNFYGLNDEITSCDDINSKDIAIYLPHNNSIKNTDGQGYYKAPKFCESTAGYSLLSFVGDSGESLDNCDIVKTARNTLKDSFYFLRGYNSAIELIAENYSVPDFTVFKIDLSSLESKIEAFNSLVSALYAKIKNTNLKNTELTESKLAVMKKLFYKIDYKSLTVPEKNINKARKLLQGKTFYDFENPDLFDNLLCVRPQK